MLLASLSSFKSMGLRPASCDSNLFSAEHAHVAMVESCSASYRPSRGCKALRIDPTPPAIQFPLSSATQELPPHLVGCLT